MHILDQETKRVSQAKHSSSQSSIEDASTVAKTEGKSFDTLLESVPSKAKPGNPIAMKNNLVQPTTDFGAISFTQGVKEAPLRKQSSDSDSDVIVPTDNDPLMSPTASMVPAQAPVDNPSPLHLDRPLFDGKTLTEIPSYRENLENSSSKNVPSFGGQGTPEFHRSQAGSDRASF